MPLPACHPRVLGPLGSRNAKDIDLAVVPKTIFIEWPDIACFSQTPSSLGLLSDMLMVANDNSVILIDQDVL